MCVFPDDSITSDNLVMAVIDVAVMFAGVCCHCSIRGC